MKILFLTLGWKTTQFFYTLMEDDLYENKNIIINKRFAEVQPWTLLWWWVIRLNVEHTQAWLKASFCVTFSPLSGLYSAFGPPIGFQGTFGSPLGLCWVSIPSCTLVYPSVPFSALQCPPVPSSALQCPGCPPVPSSALQCPPVPPSAL